MLELVVPFLLAYIVDTAMPRGEKYVYAVGGLMILCSIASMSFNITANKMVAATSCAFSKDLRDALFANIAAASAAERARFTPSSLISRLTNDTYNVHTMVDKVQRVGIRAPLLVLGGIIFSFFLEPWLALVQLLIVPLLACITYFVTTRGLSLYILSQQCVDKLVRVVRENAIGARVIRALRKSDYEISRFTAVNQSACDAELRAGRILSATNPSMTFLLNLGVTAVIAIGAVRVSRGITSPGSIIAFLSYFNIILSAVLSIMKVFLAWSKGSASARRISEVMQEQVTHQAAPSRTARFDKDCNPLICVEHASFAYNDGMPDSLRDISFTLNKGETLGIIGPTGSGKTTLLLLVLGLYQPTRGQVQLGGADILRLNPNELRTHFGTVMQNDLLLSGSVRDNIAFFRDISDDDICKAAQTAQISAFIESLPGGYDAPLDIRGNNLSGGQKQRILIARALAGQPDILLLDDAESALDYATSMQLRQDIAKNYSGITSIVISPRVSAVQGAKQILVLKDGEVIGLDAHAALKSSCAYYRRLCEMQEAAV
jgi:ATP-binding cassette subfamily B protein